MSGRTGVVVVVAGIAIAALAWIDPLFFPLSLLGPLLTGAVLGYRGIPFLAGAATWALAGILMLLSDWVINNEDQVFHLVLTVIMVGLVALGVAIGKGVGRLTSNRSTRTSVR
jgi:hypothetical protein